MNSLSHDSLIYLKELASKYPTVDSALAKIASLKAELTLPKGMVHVISDIHGDYKKLRHIINNSSGSLRPLVEELFQDNLNEAQRLQLLNLIYYPRETYTQISPELKTKEARQEFLRHTIKSELEIVREISSRYTIEQLESVFPDPFQSLYRELVFEPQMGRSEAYLHSLLDEFLENDKDLDLLRLTARLVRNLLISELVVAGDLGDRGSRIDRVIDIIRRQPSVAITWGNHDASWMGACLGHDACIATVLRISLRYRRLTQLEEGYGITLAPLERLAQTLYADDPASCFACKGEGLRDSTLMARMQKAVAIMQFKLEGQLIQRNPQYQLDSRNLLHRIDPKKGTVEIEGKTYPLKDTNFPSIDWNRPYELSLDEAKCLARIRESFVQSPVMWQHMRYVDRRGSMYLVRDQTLIFHACVPVDDDGKFLSLEVDGKPYAGKPLFEELGKLVHRAFRTKEQKDLDMLWYLWGGPRSPWFGKDKMATFETYFVEDKATHKEHKNPYFKLIHEKSFCQNILREFNVDPEQGLIVNGHVPVKIEAGESPLKDSGMAVTIDGAFSEAYGDRGYTLILGPKKTSLAQHHHFESVSEAITDGSDIIPSIQDIRVHATHRTVGDTERGSEIREHIEALQGLIQAYREYVVVENV